MSIDATLTWCGVGLSNERSTLVGLDGKGFNGWDFGGVVPDDFAVNWVDARHDVQGVFVLRFGFGALGCEGELDRIAKELVAAVDGAIEDGEFGQECVVEVGGIDVNAVVFIDVEVVVFVYHEVIPTDIVIVFDDKWVAKLGVEIFFGGRGGDWRTEDDFHGGRHAYLIRAFVYIEGAFIMSEKCRRKSRGSLLPLAILRMQWYIHRNEKQEYA